MKILLPLIILASLVISPNLLYLAGTGYNQAEGAAYLKIHPITYTLIILAALLFLMRKKNKANFLNDEFTFFSILATLILCIYCLIMGFNVSIAAVTLTTPMLFIYVALRLSKEQLNSIEYWVRILLAINAIVGIYEAITEDTILPRIAGDILVQTDLRSLGVIGHPLSSAFLSGVLVVYLLYCIVFFRQKPILRTLMLAEIGIHLLALTAFASRANIIFVFLLAFVMIFIHKGNDNDSQNKHLFWKSIIGGCITVMIIFVAQSEFAEVAVSRFLGDEYSENSTQSRFALIALLSSMNFSEWMTGISSIRRTELQNLFDTAYGVEITWVAWILSYGLIWTLLLTGILWKIFSKIIKAKGNSHLFIVVFFILSISSNQGLGGKTLMLLWFLAILFCLPGSKENNARTIKHYQATYH